MKGLNMWISVRISLFVFVVYTLVIIPPSTLIWLFFLPLVSKGVLGFFISVLLAHINLWVLILSAVIIPGIFWRLVNLRFTGIHILDLKDTSVRNWVITQMIYIPTAVILDFFHLYPLKVLHVKLFGARVKRGVIIAGLITDPSMLEVGENTNIGGFSLVLGHSLERGKVIFKKVSIGNNCGVGLGARILPGAVMKEGAFLGAHSLLLKNQEIERGETFGGVPAVNLAHSLSHQHEHER